MSIHHIECAAMLSLPASTKLVLMAFADSADKDTRVAFPGLDNVMAWSGLKRSAALGASKWLVEQGLLERIRAAKPGRRAEYLVFPRGCCALHGPLPGFESEGSENGSTVADPFSERVQQPGRMGPAQGSNGSSSYRTPPPSTSVRNSAPQPPAGTPAGGKRCPTHDSPHPNCRGCGTTSRQARSSAARTSERRALDDHRQLRESGEVMATEERSEEVLALLAETRLALRQALTGHADNDTHVNEEDTE